MATVHIEAVGESGQHFYEYDTALFLKTEGDIELIGPDVIMMQAVLPELMCALLGRNGKGRLMIQDGHTVKPWLIFSVKV